MEEMIVSIRWEGTGPLGPRDVAEALGTRWKSNFRVNRLNLERNSTTPKLVYSVPEAAKVLGLSNATVYSLLYQKKIPGIRYGTRWLVSRAGLEKQLGSSSPEDIKLIGDADKADLVAALDETIKLQDLLRNKLIALEKRLSKENNQNRLSS